MAADLRRELKVDVNIVEGRYGQFSVLVDDEEVFDAGALAFLGVLPSKRRVRELVAQRLRAAEPASDHRPDPRFRNLTPSILAGVSADEIGNAVVHHVTWCLAAAGEEARETVIRGLPPGTRAIYTTCLVDLEVNNGGFNQFFFNHGDEFAGLALAGYELLGTERYAAVMRMAIAMRETERESMAPYYEAHSLKAFSESSRHTALYEIDQRYYALGDQITDVWARFVRGNPELFVA